MEFGARQSDFCLPWSALVSGHRAVTSHISRLSSQTFAGAPTVRGPASRAAFCGWCREGELNPQDPKVGGF